MIQSLLLALAVAAPAAAPAPVAPALPTGSSSEVPSRADERVLVLGFDGADYRTTARMIEAGELPHLAELAASGTFAPLRSTNPAESAAGWAAINTGRNPVENGVPSFVNRRIAGTTPVPDTAHIKIESNVPIEEFELDGFLGLVAGRSPLELGLVGGLGSAPRFTAARPGAAPTAAAPRAAAPSAPTAPRAQAESGASLSASEIEKMLENAGSGCPLGPCQGCPHHDVQSHTCTA